METSTQEKSLMVISEIGNLLRQNSKAAALISTVRQKDIVEIPINEALKFALVFCGNNMYFAIPIQVEHKLSLELYRHRKAL